MAKKKVLTAEQYLSFIDPKPRPWVDPVTDKVVVDPATGKPQLFSPANCSEWVRMYEAGEIIIVPAKSDEKEEGSKKNQSAAASDDMELGGESQDTPEEFS